MPKAGETTFTRIRFRGGSGGYILLPVLTTTQRDALSAETGMQIYNSTTGQVEEYNGSTWRSVGQGILTTHVAALDAHTRNLLQEVRVGGWFLGLPWESTATVTLVANTLYGTLIHVPRLMTFDQIGIYVTTADAGKFARLGLYNLDGALAPSSLIHDYDAVSVGTTGLKTRAHDQQLDKGLYLGGVVSDGAPTLRRFIVNCSPLGHTATLIDSFTGYSVAQAYGALPDPFTGGSALMSFHCLIMLRVKSMD